MDSAKKERLEDVKAKFGLDPDDVGNRPRGWWIVDTIEDEEESAKVKVGDLCIKTRDGGSNTPDLTAGVYPNYRGTSEDGFDCTYRYYYYSPIAMA